MLGEYHLYIIISTYLIVKSLRIVILSNNTVHNPKYQPTQSCYLLHRKVRNFFVQPPKYGRFKIRVIHSFSRAFVETPTSPHPRARPSPATVHCLDVARSVGQTSSGRSIAFTAARTRRNGCGARSS